MKVQDFKEFVKTGSKIIKKRMIIPETEYVLFKDNKAYVTNLENTVVLDTDVEGTFLFPFEDLKKIVSKVKKGVINFSGQDPVKLETEKGVFEYAIGVDVDDFPSIPETKEKYHNFSAAKIIAIKKAKVYSSDDELRPALQGVFVEDDMVVGTNGSILKYIKTDSTVKDSFTIPKESVDLFQGGECGVYGGNNYHTFQWENMAVIFRDLDGVFPNWRAVIPSEFVDTIRVDKKAMKEMVEMAKMIDPPKNLLRMQAGGESLNFDTNSLDTGKSYATDIDAEFEEDFMVGMDIDLLGIVLKTEDGDTLTIKHTGNPSRVMIMNDNLLFMPMKLK